MIDAGMLITIISIALMLVGKQYLSKRDADKIRRVMQQLDADNKEITEDVVRQFKRHATIVQETVSRSIAGRIPSSVVPEQSPMHRLRRDTEEDEEEKKEHD